VVHQFVGLGLGHAEDLRGAAGGTGALSFTSSWATRTICCRRSLAVHGAGDGGQLSDLC
jgi:hypothetical protein